MRKTAASGEQITYQYDSLERLIAATSTRPWGETYTYDGFGNRTGAGVPVNAATNRVPTYTHDNNGNVTGMPQMTLEYNVENRLDYVYNPAGQRVMKNGVITLYGIDGKRLGMYTVGIMGPNSELFAFQSVLYGGQNPPQNVWFAGRSVAPEDRVGSRGAAGRFTPYGVEVTPSSNDAEKFATYYRDQKTGLDYAMQRYYQSGLGRFTTPDPYIALTSGPHDPSSPQSWNRYAYVNNDPLNYNDRPGLFPCPVGTGENTEVVDCEIVVVPTVGEPVADPARAAAIIKRHDKAITSTFREVLRNRINALGNCQKILSNVSVADFWAVAKDINFYDGQPGSPGSTRRQSDIVQHSDNHDSLERTVQYNVAVTLRRNNIVTNHVVLGRDFFNDNEISKPDTLLHEALHYVLQQDDDALQTYLSKFGFVNKTSDSHDISDWLRDNCPDSGTNKHDD